MSGYDPFAPEVQRDPYPHYAELRRAAPVHHLASRDFWVVSRHEDVSFALKRPDLFSSSVMGQLLLGSDPPAHTALRKRVERDFSPRRLRELEPRVRALAAERAAAFFSRGGGDVIAALAAPLPVMVIAELIGIDPARHLDFKRWADAMIAHGTGRPPPADRRAFESSRAQLHEFLREAIDSRRRAPGEDLISALLQSDGGVELSAEQVLGFTVLLLLGGSETTTHLIGNTLLALFAHERGLQRVRADPALMAAAIEETLRYDAPVQCVMRKTTGEVELAAVRVPAGKVVLLLLGSANRDERVFADPDRFDLDRGDVKQLALGGGPHYCLGATLARMEARAALDALFALPGLRLVDGDPPRVDSFVLRGPRALAVTFDR